MYLSHLVSIFLSRAFYFARQKRSWSLAKLTESIFVFFMVFASMVTARASEKLKVRVFKDIEVLSPISQKQIRAELESTDHVLFIKKENQKTDVVAELQFKNYLQRVLLAEIPMSWSDAAIKAQIIATKSYTMAKIRENTEKNFHLEGTVEDQAFKKSLRRVPAEQIQRLERLIEQTQSQFLVDNQGRVIKAFYHADCGGTTTEAKNIWPEAKSYGVAEDLFCQKRSSSKWNYKITRSEFWQKMKDFKPSEVTQSLKILPSLFETIVLKRFATFERVKEVQFASNDSEIIFRGEEIRRALGFNQVKSTQFKLSTSANFYSFSGQGYGHGVGLCQRGASFMGQQGATAEQILAHYYPQAKIAQLMK